MQASDSDQNRKWKNRDSSTAPWPKKYWDNSDCRLNLGVNLHQLTATGKISGRHSQPTPCLAILSANDWADLGVSMGSSGAIYARIPDCVYKGEIPKSIRIRPFSPHFIITHQGEAAQNGADKVAEKIHNEDMKNA